jgi:hypothetical protein
MSSFLIENLVGALLGGGSFLLGYHIGRNHERQGWVIWLDARIPRLKGQRPSAHDRASASGDPC